MSIDKDEAYDNALKTLNKATAKADKDFAKVRDKANGKAAKTIAKAAKTIAKALAKAGKARTKAHNAYDKTLTNITIGDQT